MDALLFFGAGKSYKGRKWHDSNVRFTLERTPGAVASLNFRKYMLIQGIDRGEIDTYCVEVLNMEKSRFMNMKTLAAVYMFMIKNKIYSETDVGGAYEREVFSEQNMDQYILPLLPNKTSKQNKVYIRERRTNADIIELENLQIIIEFRATFIRYMMTVLKYRSTPKLMTSEEAREILDDFHEILLEEQEDEYLDGILSKINVPSENTLLVEDNDIF